MASVQPLKFAIFGTGFWARFQLAAWSELPGARCVALYNRTRSRAVTLARDFGIDEAAVYDDPRRLLDEQPVDFVDIIVGNDCHSEFVRIAAEYRKPAICQKPLADSLEEARAMLAACEAAGVSLFVHENWRWQTQVRELKRKLDSGVIGAVQRARVHYCNSFPVFENQPFLRELPRFILMDIGTHILDTARFLFGEAGSVYCQTRRVNPTIRGEDMATAMIRTADGVTVTCEMSYASRTEIERFPETYVYVEGDRGFLELGPDFWIRTTTADGTHAKRYPPPRYAWADPPYDCIHVAIVECNRNLLAALQNGGEPETSARDNLRTLELVFGCYESAARNAVVSMTGGGKQAVAASR